MAGVHYSISTLIQLTSNCQNPTKSSIQSTVSSVRLPSMLLKRRNHLRPKILKTLRKPYPNPLSPHQPPRNPIYIIPIDPTESYAEPNVPIPPGQLSGNPRADTEFEEIEAPCLVGEDSISLGVDRVAETSTLVDGSTAGLGGLSGRSFFKLGLYFVGFFVFQSVFAFWMMGLLEPDDNDGVLENEDQPRGNLKVQLRDGEGGLNGSGFTGEFGIQKQGFKYVGEEGMEVKIDKIRRMARDARAKERMKLLANGEDLSGYGDNNSMTKIGIIKEVDQSLSRLRKSLKLNREKSPSLDIYVGMKLGERERKKVLESNKGEKMLMFEKKYKPKGFGDSDNGNATEDNYNNESTGLSLATEESQVVDVGSLNRIQKIDKQNGCSPNETMLPDEDGRENSTPLQALKGMGIHTRMEKNAKQQTGCENKGLELQDSKISPNIHGVSQSNCRSNASQVRSKTIVGRGKDKLSNTKPDLWWLNLPYVLGIILQKGPDDGLQGFYTLKSTSKSPNQKQTSYTITFEDRVDAMNFSSLLESFFADLEDTTIDIVPLSVKALSEAVKSRSMNVIVVKKGQFQLYAGQPLADVEAILYKMIAE